MLLYITRYVFSQKSFPYFFNHFLSPFQLRNSVTTIIHNAWKLDFNLSLSSFEPNVQATRNLIDFARSSPYAASLKFLFTSSISSAYSWDKTQGSYPEDIVMESRYAVGNGYGESKYISERVSTFWRSVFTALTWNGTLFRFWHKVACKLHHSE